MAAFPYIVNAAVVMFRILYFSFHYKELSTELRTMLRFTVRDIEIGMLLEVPFLYKGNGMMYST